MRKKERIKLIILAMAIVLPWSVNAQSDSESDRNFRSLQKNSTIWAGSGSINHNKDYMATADGYETIRNTEISIDLKYLKLTGSNIGLGVHGFGSIFISDGFGSVGSGKLALGPVARYLFFQKNAVNLYLEGSYLLGYNLALNDASGSTDNNDVRFRSSLKFGSSYRFSNNIGIFMEVGPEWEGDFPGFNSDARGVHLSIGFQLFKF